MLSPSYGAAQKPQRQLAHSWGCGFDHSILVETAGSLYCKGVFLPFQSVNNRCCDVLNHVTTCYPKPLPQWLQHLLRTVASSIDYYIGDCKMEPAFINKCPR